MQEETATACSAPTVAANSASKACTSRPVVTQPDCSTRVAPEMASGEIQQPAKGTTTAVPFALGALAIATTSICPPISSGVHANFLLRSR